MMKVAIDASPLMINRYSGLAEVVHNLLLNLPSDDNKSDFSLFMNYFKMSDSNGGICYPGKNKIFLRIPRRLVEWWWKYNWPPIDYYLQGINIFHGLHINVPPKEKMKTVLTVHDCRYVALPELYNSKDVQNYRNQMEISLKRVDMVATVSEFTRQEIIKYFSFPEDRVRTIHNGFSLNHTGKKCSEEKIGRFLKDNNIPHFYLLYTGVLDPRKNLSRLIEAIAVCRKESKVFPELVLIGIPYDQWIKSDQAGKAKEIGIFDNIHVGGIVEKDILCRLTKKAIALCYPSLYEGFGFPPLEAMSLGVPVLAGKSSSIPEITEDAACLVDPESVNDIARGLNRLVYDNEYRQRLVELGYRQIKKFSWEKAAAEYLSLYEEVFSS
jgi:glycosyltransferase involved in cell wall biosynthesis